MANVGKFIFFKHLRAESNQYVLHYRKGHVVREGAGLSYWFNSLNAAVAQIPVEDCETTFVLKERSADLQDVSIQVTLRYRVTDPRRAVARFNFTISLDNGSWTDEPLERLASVWQQRAQSAVRRYITSVPLLEAVTSGAVVMKEAMDAALQDDSELENMGLAIVDVQVARVAPTAELEKALQMPTREALQQKADEATFQRRALAVENERAIKENEIANEIELTSRQEELIDRQGANDLLRARLKAASLHTRVEGELERENLKATSYARTTEERANGDANAIRVRAIARADGEARRVEVWKAADRKVLLGLALQEFAGKIDHIQHLSLSPSVLGDAFQTFLLTEADK